MKIKKKNNLASEKNDLVLIRKKLGVVVVLFHTSFRFVKSRISGVRVEEGGRGVNP